MEFQYSQVQGFGVETLIEYLKAGESIDYFLDGFPTVTKAQVISLLEQFEKQLIATICGGFVNPPYSLITTQPLCKPNGSRNLGKTGNHHLESNTFR